MKNKTPKGFQELSIKEQKEISAGGLGAIVSILGPLLSNIGGMSSVATNIWTSAQKQQLIDKIKNSNKGEIEFGKDGQFKIKWDNDSLTSSKNSTIIF